MAQLEHGDNQVVSVFKVVLHCKKVCMKIQSWLVTGATGLIGQALVKTLLTQGHEVRTVGRTLRSVHGASPFAWSPTRGQFPLEALDDIDVVVHLASASVGKRWTGAHRRAILESRTLSTHLLRESMIKVGFKGTWIQASAIGIYGNNPQPCDEQTAYGSGFLAQIAQAWENAAQPDKISPFRLVRMRLGLVLSPKGGPLEKLLPIYKVGLGAPLGSGKQPMGWIHIDDVVQFILWAASNEVARGAFNVVAPEAVSNASFSECLATALNRPHWAPAVPAFALNLAMGSMSSLLLEGQNATPNKLLKAGFEWRYPALMEALIHCIG